jgi:hypothetical protein
MNSMNWIIVADTSIGSVQMSLEDIPDILTAATIAKERMENLHGLKNVFITKVYVL